MVSAKSVLADERGGMRVQFVSPGQTNVPLKETSEPLYITNPPSTLITCPVK